MRAWRHVQREVRDVEATLAEALGDQAAISKSTRRRTKVIGRLPGETSCLTLVWAVLDRASRGWRGLTMTSDGLRLLQDLRRSLLTRHASSGRDPPPSPSLLDQPETVRATA
jgi:putative transposase